MTGSGNSGLPVNGYPAKFRDVGNNPNIPELIVVGAVDVNGERSSKSNFANYVTVYAPGKSLGEPGGGGAISCASSVGTISTLRAGTSLCKL